MADDKKSAIVTVRSSGSTALPPAQKGFDKLLVPETYEGKTRFELDAHYTPAGIEALGAKIQAAYDGQLDKLYEEVAKAKGTKKPPIPVEEYLASALKEAKPRSTIQLPFLKLRGEAFTRNGSPIAMGCWGPHNEVLDLKALGPKMAKGTILQPIVYLNLWASKAAFWVPQPSIKMVGIRILKLVEWTGGGARPPEDADDKAIAAVLGKDFDMSQDLSAFGLGQAAPATDDLPNDGPDLDAMKDKLF